MYQKYPATINIIVSRSISDKQAFVGPSGFDQSLWTLLLMLSRLQQFSEVHLRHPPPHLFLSFSVECVSWFWVTRSDWKKEHPPKKRVTKTSRNRRPGTLASLLWSPETTRHELKINMAEKLDDVIVKFRQLAKKDQPPKFYIVTMLSFQIKRSI